MLLSSNINRFYSEERKSPQRPRSAPGARNALWNSASHQGDPCREIVSDPATPPSLICMPLLQRLPIAITSPPQFLYTSKTSEDDCPRCFQLLSICQSGKYTPTASKSYELTLAQARRELPPPQAPHQQLLRLQRRCHRHGNPCNLLLT